MSQVFFRRTICLLSLKNQDAHPHPNTQLSLVHPASKTPVKTDYGMTSRVSQVFGRHDITLPPSEHNEDFERCR